MEKLEITNSQGLKIAGVMDFSTEDKISPTVVCLHGLGGTKESNQEFTDILNSLGIATVRIDFQGSGESDGKYEDKTITGFLDDAQSTLDYFCSMPRVDKNKIGIVGYSMGAVVAILLASRDLRIKTLVAFSPAVKAAQVIADMYDQDDFAKAREKGYVEFKKNSELKKLNYKFFEDADQYDLTQEAQNIPYRFLVVGAAKDSIVPLEQIEEFHQRVKNTQLLTLANSDHNLEEDWPTVEQAIEDWFKDWLKVGHG